jgi:alcohol dehydrogenase class IV
MLPHVVRYNVPSAPARYAELARALGVTGPGSDGELAARGAGRLAELCSECGIRPGLAGHGIPADAIPRLAAEGMKVTRLLKNNPRELTLADAETIFRQAY